LKAINKGELEGKIRIGLDFLKKEMCDEKSIEKGGGLF